MYLIESVYQNELDGLETPQNTVNGSGHLTVKEFARSCSLLLIILRLIIIVFLNSGRGNIMLRVAKFIFRVA